MNRFYLNFAKRIFDITFSFLALLILAPMLLFITIMVRKKLGKPAIFIQARPGRNEKIFNLYKYRTMSNECDRNGNLLPDLERQTKFGNFLRKTSLDELPELINILKGEMSFVGPRPLLIKYLPFYSETERKRHTVRPGLTGLAQISGRNNLDWNTRLAKDVEYVETISFLNDIKIILYTIQKVFTHKDVVCVGNFKMKDLDQERQ